MTTPTHNPMAWLDEALEALDINHQRRTLITRPSAGGTLDVDGKRLLNFASNDYLDFLNRPELKEAAIAATTRYGAGSGASRLVSGTLTLHEELEAAAAAHKGYPCALLFGSGYMTNIGAITALVGRDDVVLADRLIHASLIDAIRLSGAGMIRFHHNDAEDLKRRLADLKPSGKKLIVTESVFSMDGDLAPLPEIARVAGEYEAMALVDEAHATGVWGPEGRGLIAEHRLQPDIPIAMSTFSKALGGYGGVIAGSAALRDWLINKARSFIYTTAPPPASCAAALAALRLLESEPALGGTLLERAAFFRNALHALGFTTGASCSQIIPVIIGDNAATMKLAEALRQRGILVGAIRPPTVPVGTSRLRFSITLAHRQEDLAFAADQLARSAAEIGWSP
ncbi:MAG TPA: 8-amino-7-oxononanoate synthase [Kiritimatiellia bacterium]|nr:8-amino-7-oxononanoate synthase [Kiritimatiellia bacterium]HMO98511.1 8-amino-7-oxononanoate synthase [Kiritimatiellia bacterium]HMP95819.1 8-amino-7-oxononanoate synthase [Kiritimatiellia bacterium]